MTSAAPEPSGQPRDMGMLDRLIHFCLTNKLVVALAVLFAVLWGAMVAPFDWELDWLPRRPVPVDAIPDIGENQQIVFTRWMGRSPQDVEDQISYPLTVAMLGIPGVRTVRTYSMFGFSTIYVIFKEDVEFYWSRSRVLEKLSSLPAGSLPAGVQPTLGPDATALGQVYWYTLEGRDQDGNPAGGWDLHELRSIQDWYVRYALLAAEGISEVASVGGFVQEYQIDVDPDAMRAHGVSLDQVFMAVKMSNVDVGARTIEINQVEYVIRGVGFIENVEDVENAVISVRDNVPVYVRNVAQVTRGPALRRGALDKGGAEVVGGVAVVRYRENPLAAIKNLKAKIAETSPGLPEKAVVDYQQVSRAEVRAFSRNLNITAYAQDGELNQQAWLEWAKRVPRTERPPWLTVSRVTIVPFYDRTGLIYETLGTLNTALVEEILVTIIVILVMVLHLRSSMVISATLPLAVLLCFVAMKLFRIDANVVALSGIAIAIGSIVDMGVIICENILKHLDEADAGEDRLAVVFRATSEVGSAVLTAILTTVVSFLPVFTMIGAEGKLFRPLAFTKTFALFASVIVALAVVPAVAHVLFTFQMRARRTRVVSLSLLAGAGLVVAFVWTWWAGAIIVAIAAWHLGAGRIPERARVWTLRSLNLVVAVLVAVVLTRYWLPLGPAAGFAANAAVVMLPIGGLLAFFVAFGAVYGRLLRWFLNHKLVFLTIPTGIIILGGTVWLGAHRILAWLPDRLRQTTAYSRLAHSFPGLGKEFMPDLDEGSFLYMPTTMPHASIGEVLNVLQKQDMAFSAIPEVESAVGKLGRAETPLDPAPVSMIETIINYKPEYLIDRNGRSRRFRFNPDATDFFRDEHGRPVPAADGEPYKTTGAFTFENGQLVPDPDGRPFRLWRDALDPELNPGRNAWNGIRSPDDIWDEIVLAGAIPGTTSAPKLQPIAARIVMLQSGMRAPMGIKVKGPDLDTIEAVGLELERLLKQAPGVEPGAVIADRIVGKPYLEIRINRKAAARYGVPIRRVQDVIEIAVGGRTITTTVEGRQRYPVRVRYLRELRDRMDALGRILVPAANGQQIPLIQLADIEYVRGPQVIKSEDTFLVGYVLFDKKPGLAEVDVVEACQRFLQSKISSGEFTLPAGVSYTFAGNYENQLRAAKTLSVVLPLALFIIFMILYLQFRSVSTTLLVFSGIIVAWAGGFSLVWLYGQSWFLDMNLAGVSLRELFQIQTINLSVAIWVGFLALFGIASDNGVVIATYLDQSFAERDPPTVTAIREATVAGAVRRIRPCLMTSATTILALLPILTSTGRGSDIMVPMAIPSFGGMLVVLVSVFVVPVLYSCIKEWQLKLAGGHTGAGVRETAQPLKPETS